MSLKLGAHNQGLSHKLGTSQSGSTQSRGLAAAFSSAFFLGLAPVFGRQAILMGLPPMAVVALRTLLAALLLLLVLSLFQRQYLYIYPAGLMGCLLAGGINGAGSLLFYGSLARIDASVGQMLNSTYPIFVALWLILDHQKPSRLTILRLVLMLPAVYLLTQAHGELDLLGMAMMLGAAALYGLHLPINQRVLYEMPAQTVTLYTLLAMSGVVVPFYLLNRVLTIGVPFTSLFTAPAAAWWPVIGLTLATFFSRLTLFLGVKNLGGMQTAMIGLCELLVTLVIAFAWLGERLSPLQYLGAGLLLLSVGLVALEKQRPSLRRTGGWLHWLSPPTPNIDLLNLQLPPHPSPPESCTHESCTHDKDHNHSK